ncbi:modular serine protease [Drosophila virilis]|uniref:modular serine protease n=1 Tax=Drosophila virilis TaxID=7244 RepID=UPI0038B2B2D4
MLSGVILIILAAYQLSFIGAADNLFSCWNGECIPERAKCNGVLDCEYGSDETFLECYNNTCDESAYFRCNYGGCILDQLKCNGESDCLDGSDENKYLCADDNQLDSLLNELRGECSPAHAVSCDKKCLKWSRVCNGHNDCTDSFDESAELCTVSQCPADSFRCKNGACINAGSFCNHVLDCADGSDEIPSICRKLGEMVAKMDTCPQLLSEQLPQSTPTKEESSVWQTDTCSLETSEGRLVRDYFSGFEFGPADGVPGGSIVEVSCNEGYVNFGSTINRCMKSQWHHEGFGCMRLCSQKDDIAKAHFATQCIHDGHLVNCQSDSQLFGTELIVTCADGYKSALVTSKPGEHSCNEMGTWTTMVSNPECEPICGIKSAQHPQLFPWTVSIFQRNSNNAAIYDFRCAGTIVSAQFVITAAACFTDQLNSTEQQLNYNIVQGNHSISYSLNEDHGYVLHNIKNIHTLAVNSAKKLVLLQLTGWFSLGAKVRPICLADSKAALNIKRLGDFQNYQLGGARTLYDNNKYILTHIAIKNTTLYNINQFLMPIQRKIKNTVA